jgi:hypothetical protein
MGLFLRREVVLLKAVYKNHIASNRSRRFRSPPPILKRGLPRGRRLALLLVAEQLAIVERSAKTGGVFAVLAL